MMKLQMQDYQENIVTVVHIQPWNFKETNQRNNNILNQT